MGFEIPVDVDYFEHPKTLELISIVGPEADIYPLRLWRWCALYAKNGHVKGGRWQIESAVKWTGQPAKLHKALIRCGFVDPDGKTVHDFTEHIGRAILLYEQKKKKQREKYARGINPEFVRKNSGSIPPILSNTTLDEKPNPRLSPEGNGGDSIALAEKVAFLQRKGGNANWVNEWDNCLSDLLANGFTVMALDADIEKTKGINGTLKSESPWDLKKRLLKASKPTQDIQAEIERRIAEGK